MLGRGALEIAGFCGKSVINYEARWIDLQNATIWGGMRRASLSFNCGWLLALRVALTLFVLIYFLRCLPSCVIHTESKCRVSFIEFTRPAVCFLYSIHVSVICSHLFNSCNVSLLYYYYYCASNTRYCDRLLLCQYHTVQLLMLLRVLLQLCYSCYP